MMLVDLPGYGYAEGLEERGQSVGPGRYKHYLLRGAPGRVCLPRSIRGRPSGTGTGP